MSRSVRLLDCNALILWTTCAPLLVSRAAFAEAPGPVDLRWDAPVQCPPHRAVMDRVRALAGTTPGTHGPIRADARVESARDGRGGLRLTLTVHYGQTSGTRVITSSSCDDLAGATAVAISLLLGGDFGEETGSTGGAASGSAPGTSAHGSAGAAPASGEPHPPPSHGGEPADSPRTGHTEETRSALPARRWHIDVRAPTLLVDVGSLPHAGFGFGAAAAFRYDAFRVALGGALWLSQTVTNDDGPSPTGAGFDRWSLDLAGCRAWTAGIMEVAPCMSLSVDDVSARGTGPQVNPLSTQTSWVSLGPEVLGSLRLTDYAALVLGVSARWATSQPRFSVAGLGELYQVSPITAEALLGCDWIL
jgi:hypothetical protein